MPDYRQALIRIIVGHVVGSVRVITNWGLVRETTLN